MELDKEAPFVALERFEMQIMLNGRPLTMLEVRITLAA